MNGAYFVCMLIGISWLAVWSVRREPGRRNWLGSLFDMAGDPDEARAGTQPRWARRGAKGPGSWRERGRAGAHAEPSDHQQALPQRGATQPRRVRREQASASRRRR